MTNKSDKKNIQAVLCQYPEGFLLKDIESKVGMNEAALLTQLKNLWDEGSLTGVVSDGCCQTGCGEYCTSYMNPHRVWKLS